MTLLKLIQATGSAAAVREQGLHDIPVKLVKVVCCGMSNEGKVEAVKMILL